MAQTAQIVPKYKHPHVATYVNDYTTYEETITSSAADTKRNFLAVFRSSKGIDNKLVKITTLKDFQRIYGSSDYQQYGQPLMMPYALLGAGNNVWCMRVTTKGATYANCVLSLLWRIGDYTTTTQVEKDVTKYIQATNEAGEALYLKADSVEEPTYTNPITQKQDGESQPLYVDADGDATTTADGNTALYEYVEGNTTDFVTDPASGKTAFVSKVVKELVPESTTEEKFIIKYIAEPITGPATTINSVKGLRLAAQSLADPEYKETNADTGDETTWHKVPVVLFNSVGRGTYANDYRWRIASDSSYDTEYKIKMYSFQALSSTLSTGVVSLETTTASVLTPTRYERSTYINDIIAEADAGDIAMNVECIDYNLEEVYNEFAAYVESLKANPDTADKAGTLPSVDQWDPFFGKIMLTNNISLKNMVIDEDSIPLDAAEGISLSGGSDGATDEESIEAAYIDAFEGTFDKRILVPRRCPLDAIFDANYSMNVKDSLVNLAIARDTMVYLDAGVNITDTNQIDAMIEDFASYDSYLISKDFQHYTVRDLTSRRRVPVTMTYLYAEKLGTHLANNGIHIPFVKSYCQLSGHIKDSLEPCIETTDMDLKEQLYNARFNYFEAIDENTFQRSCQNTSQMTDSDLLEENNARVLLYLKRNLEMDCLNTLYDFTSAADRARFTERAMTKYSPMEGKSVQSISINFAQSEWEAERSILHCYCSVQFRGLHKRTIIEIDVNKRDYTA